MGACEAITPQLLHLPERLLNLYPHQKMKEVKMLVAQSCLNVCDRMDCSQAGSSVFGISQARILQWVAIWVVFQGIFLTQGSNMGLLHCRQILSPEDNVIEIQVDYLPSELHSSGNFLESLICVLMLKSVEPRPQLHLQVLYHSDPEKNVPDPEKCIVLSPGHCVRRL